MLNHGHLIMPENAKSFSELSLTQFVKQNYRAVAFPRVGTDIYLGRQQLSQVYVSYVGVKRHISHLDPFFFFSLESWFFQFGLSSELSAKFWRKTPSAQVQLFP